MPHQTTSKVGDEIKPKEQQHQYGEQNHGQLMTLPEVQASNAPFPPGSKVYALNNLEPPTVISFGEVVEVLVKLEMALDKSACELIYKVRDENELNALSRSYFEGTNAKDQPKNFLLKEKQIRFRNGNPVYLANAEEGNNESKEAIVLGMCDVPCHLRSETTPYWYSIISLADRKCEHEVNPNRVKHRHTKNDTVSPDIPLSGNIQNARQPSDKTGANGAVVIKEEQCRDEMSNSVESGEEVDGIMENILKRKEALESNEITPEQSITEGTHNNQFARTENNALQENHISSTQSIATKEKGFSSETNNSASYSEPSSSNEMVQRGYFNEQKDSFHAQSADKPPSFQTEKDFGVSFAAEERQLSNNQEWSSQQHSVTETNSNIVELQMRKRSDFSDSCIPKKKARLSIDAESNSGNYDAQVSPCSSQKGQSSFPYGCEVEFRLPSHLVIDLLIGQQGHILQSLEKECNSNIKEKRIQSKSNKFRHIFLIEANRAEAVTFTKSQMMDRLRSDLPPLLRGVLPNTILVPKGKYFLNKSEKRLNSNEKESVVSKRSSEDVENQNNNSNANISHYGPNCGQGSYPYGCEIQFQLPSNILIDVLIGERKQLLESLGKHCGSTITEERMQDKTKTMQHTFFIEGTTAHAVTSTKSRMIEQLKLKLSPSLIRALKNTRMVPKGKYVLSKSDKTLSQHQRALTHVTTFASYNGKTGAFCARMSISDWARNYLPADNELWNMVRQIGNETGCEFSFKLGRVISFHSSAKPQAQDARDRAEAALIEYFSDEDKTRAIIDFCSARKGFDHIDNFDDIVLSHTWPYNADRAFQSICVKNAPNSFYSLLHQSPVMQEMIYKSTGCEIYEVVSTWVPYFLLRSSNDDYIHNAIKVIEDEALRIERR